MKLQLIVPSVMLMLAASLSAGEIHDAIGQGDTLRVATLLAANPALLEAVDDSGDTPLICAAYAGQTEAPDQAWRQSRCDSPQWQHGPAWGGVRRPY
jgi:hypothetical protein